MVQRLGTWLWLALGFVVVVLICLVVIDLVDIRQFIPLTEHYDWLAFVGATLGGIVGGLLTFGGVYLTLRQQRASDLLRHEGDNLRNRLSIMPLLEFAVSYDPSDFDNSRGQLADEPGTPNINLDGAERGGPDTMEFLYDLVLKNVGLGHALLTRVRLEISDNTNDPVETHEGGFVNFLVKSGARRHLRHYIYAPRNAPRFTDPRQYAYSIKATLGFQDLLGNEYEQTVLTSIAKGLYAEEDPESGGSPFSSFHYAERPKFLGQ